MATLELRDLRKNFGPVEVVPGVNLDVSEHEFVVLVGPSGCGKSTILRMIAGLTDVTSGNICFDSETVNDWDVRRRNVARAARPATREQSGLDVPALSGVSSSAGVAVASAV